MPLPTGTRIGAYEITGALGAGGMGEVYRARDTTLGRDVAVKVLPAAVASDPERLARFGREAKLLASLSHANIAQVYGLEPPSTGSGQVALVMELAAGEDLTAQMNRGAMSVHDALPIAIQIAYALEAAHERGIIHRDLKPANVKVTDDGAVKVLDFGLAKALDANASSASAEAMNSPTLTAQATAAGIILGTAAYMSPEQARGRDADKRADVWAFGIVLFEMLSGARLFQGETISDTLAAVLRQDIPWSALPAGTHQEIVRLLRRCLERDRKNRLHDIADARIVLEDVVRGGAKDVTVAPAAAARRPWWPLAVAAAVLIALGFASGRWASPATVPGDTRTIRLVIPRVPGNTELSEPAVAPDGSFVVFVGGNGAGQRLYLQRLDESAPKPIERTEGAERPVVSQDSKWIAFQRTTRLEKIAVDGGEPLFIADLGRAGAPGMAWLAGGTIVFPTSWLSPLSAIADDRTVRPVSTLDTARGEIGHWFPHPLPDGRHVLITVWTKATGINDAETAVLDLETGKHTVLFKGAEGRFVSPGFIVFFRAGAFHAIRFDPDTRTVSGDPVRVLDDAFGNTPDGDSTQTDLVATGTLAYLSGPSILPRELAWISEGGKLEALKFPARPYGDLDLTVDGKRLVVTTLENSRYLLRVMDLDRGNEQVLDLPGSSFDPAWHPDGRRVAFTTLRKGDFDAYWTDLATSAPSEPLLVSDFDDSPISFFRDGKSLIVRQSEKDGRYWQKLLPLVPPGPVRPLVAYSSASNATASSDGQFVAFESSRSGRSEVYVQPATGGEAPKQISNNGGSIIVWASNGKDLLYLREPEIIAVSYTVEGGVFRIGKERVWSRVEGNYNTDVLEIAPDGRALVEIDRQQTQREIRVIVNWQAEILKKMK